ncbi:hypothetical protein Dimus_033212 [Dionaea muscipula]
MDLPQSQPFRLEAKKPTHDFLSLYRHSSTEQDPSPSHGGYLRTHDFLRPLEREQKLQSKEDRVLELNVENYPPISSSSSVEHPLPGGVGTYSINHISFNSRVAKPDSTFFNAVTLTSNNQGNDDISNCSSYTGSGFTLWDQSESRKRKAGKENLRVADVVVEQNEAGQWPMDKPSKSSDNHSNNFGSIHSSQSSLHRNQGFMAMLKSAKGLEAKEEEDEEEEGDFAVKNESTSQKGELQVKVEEQSSDRRASTPRSKHSATEQRRRCKINDRFQMLRELIPHGNQKRDKASFLLEVITYIQFLQEKVEKYERSYPGWNHEHANLPSWSNCHRPTESSVDKYRGANDVASPPLMFGVNLDDGKNATSLNTTRDRKNPALAFKAVGRQGRMAETSNGTSVQQFQLRENRSCPSHETNESTEMLKEQGMIVEGGSVHISTMYSQG